MAKPVVDNQKDTAELGTSVQSAVDAFYTYIDEMAETFQRNDFDAYFAGVSLPMMLRTDGEVMIVKEVDQLREGFDAWVKMVRRNSIDHTIHKVVDAIWLQEDQIAALYETTLMAGDVQVMPTFTTMMELKKSVDYWRAHAVVNGMKNIKWPITSPIFVPDDDGKA